MSVTLEIYTVDQFDKQFSENELNQHSEKTYTYLFFEQLLAAYRQNRENPDFIYDHCNWCDEPINGTNLQWAFWQVTIATLSGYEFPMENTETKEILYNYSPYVITEKDVNYLQEIAQKLEVYQEFEQEIVWLREHIGSKIILIFA